MDYKYRVYLKNKDGERREMNVKSHHKTARDMAYDMIKVKDGRIIFETVEGGVCVCVADDILEFDIKPI